MDKSSPSVPQPSNTNEHSTDYIQTPFGARRKSFGTKPKVQDEKKPISNNVDSQLLKLFAKRQEKNSNPNALQEFEDTVNTRMADTRAGTKPNKDGEDSELSKKLQKRKNKIT